MDTWSEAGGDEPENMVQLMPKKITAHRNLIQKLEAIMASYELQEKYSTQLTPHSLSVIGKLLKTKPEFFRVVESTLVRNINDNKIQATDVPYVISIISQLYNLLALFNIETYPHTVEPTADTCGCILKFIFSVAIREHLVQIDDETDATLLLVCCDNIIDACIKLLKIKPPKPISVLVSEPTPVPKQSVVVVEKKHGCCA